MNATLRTRRDLKLKKNNEKKKISKSASKVNNLSVSQPISKQASKKYHLINYLVSLSVSLDIKTEKQCFFSKQYSKSFNFIN